MRSSLRVSLWVVAGFVLVVPATLRVAAESNRDAAQSHQGMSGMSHAGMQPTQTPADQMARDLGKMMADLTTTVRDFRTAHDAMAGQSRDQLIGSVQGMFDQMREFQGAMNVMATSPEMMHSADAMKPLQQAARDFQQMGKAFQAMLKSMDKAMKPVHRDAGR